MDIDNLSVAVGIGSLSLAGLAIGIFLLIPSVRKKESLEAAERQLSVRYAQEIASGDAVIIAKDKNAYKRIVFYVFLAAVAILVIQRIQHAIDGLRVTCTQLWDLNSFFVLMIYLQGASALMAAIFLWTTYSSYQQAVRDGYSPPRNSKGLPVDKIAFKLTPQIKCKLQFGVFISTVISIFILSVPMMFIMIITHGSVHDFNSFKNANRWLQQSCLLELTSQHRQ